MFYLKNFLVKGLAGLGACGALAGVAIVYGGGLGEWSSAPTTKSQKNLLEKVGLDCGDPADGSFCTKKDGSGNIRVRRGTEAFELSDLPNGNGGRIRLHKVRGGEYEENIKLSIEGGDIAGENTNKLEELETYEIKLGAESDGETLNGKHYLSRKTEAREEIKRALRLSCDLPQSGTLVCEGLDVGSIPFEKRGEEQPTLSGTVKLTIEKLTERRPEFPYGYRFSFQGLRGNATLTWSGSKSTTFVDGRDTEYSVLKEGNKLVLGETWSLERVAGRVGLICGGSPGENQGLECSKKEGVNIRVKQDNSVTFDVSEISVGKMKVYGDQSYNRGFRFTVEEGYIGANDGASSGNRMEELESYEAKEEGGTWYLVQKTKAKDEIKSRLGIDGSCTFPEDNSTPPSNSNSCGLDVEKIKRIRFGNGRDGGATMSSGNVTLTITKLSDSPVSEFPFGYSFSLRPSQKLTIKDSPEDSINANMDVEFKIRKNNGALTLERAWTLETLAEKVGLKECSKEGEKTFCNVENTKLNIKQDEGTGEEGKSKSSSSRGKIGVHRDIAGHREGFRFVIEEGDIGIENSTSITKLEEFETYEIEEDGGKYFLSRKTKALREIGKILGIPENCDELDKATQSSSCTNMREDTLKNIKFEGRGNGEIAITGDGSSNIALKIDRTSDSNFPLGYRFTLSSDKDISIPQTAPSSPLTVKKKTNTEFKIKKNNGDLTLERAWSVAELAKKVGLNCGGGGGRECSLDDGGINVDNGSSNKYKNLSRNDSSDDKKVKYEENREGYSQGFCFYAEEDIVLKNGESTGENMKIFKKNTSGVYYEIKEEGDS